MAITTGTWGIGAFKLPDFGLTEKLPSSYTAQNYQTMVNPNQPSPAYNIYGQPNYQVPTGAIDTKQPAVDQNPYGGARSSTPAMPSAPTVQSSTPSFNNDANGTNQAIDNIFNPAYSMLQQREALLPQLRDTAIQQLNDTTASLTDSLNSQKLASDQSIASQKLDIEAGKKSAMAEAIRNYNALMNQTQNRYGGQVGSTQFISELISQEFARGTGQINQGYQQSMQKIQDYALQVDAYTMDQFRKIEREKQTSLKSIADQMQERLLAIGADKYTLERQKAEQKYDALAQSISAQRQVDLAYQQALFDAQSFRAQREADIKGMVSQLQKEWSTTQQDIQPNVAAATTSPQYSGMIDRNTFAQVPQSYKPYSTRSGSEEDPWNVDSYFA